jgi:P-type conjugative transfer protein TrbJ
MRPKLKLASAVAASTIAIASPCQSGVPVFCVNCSTEWTQVVQLAKQAQQLMTELQSYQTQLLQYANMVQNTVALPTQAWGTVQADIIQVRNLSNAASLLSGNAGSILTRLQSAEGYVNQLGMIGNMPGQFTMWQQTMGNNLNTMGRVLGLQQDQASNDAALLARLQAASGSATGQMQAIQAGNELASANAAQLHEIHQTLMATAQMMANQMAVDADRKASEDTALQEYVAPQRIPLNGYASW